MNIGVASHEAALFRETLTLHRKLRSLESQERTVACSVITKTFKYHFCKR